MLKLIFMLFTAGFVYGENEAPAIQSVEYCIGKNCELITHDEQSNTATSIFGMNSNCGPFDVFVQRDPFDCHNYLLCYFGITIKRNCPTGFAFSPSSQSCITEDKVETCSKVECPHNETVTIFPDHENCHNYYICMWNYPFKFQCNEGTQFDPLYKTCVTNDEKSCSTDIPVTTPSTPIESSSVTTPIIPIDSSVTTPSIDTSTPAGIPETTTFATPLPDNFGPTTMPTPEGPELPPSETETTSTELPPITANP